MRRIRRLVSNRVQPYPTFPPPSLGLCFAPGPSLGDCSPSTPHLVESCSKLLRPRVRLIRRSRESGISFPVCLCLQRLQFWTACKTSLPRCSAEYGGCFGCRNDDELKNEGSPEWRPFVLTTDQKKYFNPISIWRRPVFVSATP
jgi:hypothetical protein